MVATLSVEEFDELIVCLNHAYAHDTEMSDEERSFNRGVRKKMIKCQKKIRQKLRRLEGRSDG